uniref:Early dehydration-responsive 1 n=1 Tax=Linderniella brevidens TaxID=263965 RepID=A0A097HTM0_9LAMI|nr:early dehydration-responsive 1 [Linderniella brevidens]
MSMSAVKPVACLVAPVNRANGSDPKASRVDMLSRKPVAALQMKETEKPVLEENSMSTSRRGILHLAAAALSLGLVPLISPPLDAEAIPRDVAKKKVTKKLEELKEKAGLSKPKDKEDKKTTFNDRIEEGKKKANNKGDDKEIKVQSKIDAAAHKALPKLPLQEPPLIPSLPNILNDKTVETSFRP